MCRGQINAYASDWGHRNGRFCSQWFTVRGSGNEEFVIHSISAASKPAERSVIFRCGYGYRPIGIEVVTHSLCPDSINVTPTVLVPAGRVCRRKPTEHLSILNPVLFPKTSFLHYR